MFFAIKQEDKEMHLKEYIKNLINFRAFSLALGCYLLDKVIKNYELFIGTIGTIVTGGG